jgi:hypothetical protein
MPPRADLRELWTPDDIFAAAVKDGADVLLTFREDYRVEWKSAPPAALRSSTAWLERASLTAA